jgi:hypothetical protein
MAVVKEMAVPMSSRRTLSQRFATWIGHQQRLDASRSRWCLSEN